MIAVARRRILVTVPSARIPDASVLDSGFQEPTLREVWYRLGGPRPMSVTEIAQTLGLTKESVRKELRSALAKLGPLGKSLGAHPLPPEWRPGWRVCRLEACGQLFKPTHRAQWYHDPDCRTRNETLLSRERELRRSRRGARGRLRVRRRGSGA